MMSDLPPAVVKDLRRYLTLPALCVLVVVDAVSACWRVSIWSLSLFEECSLVPDLESVIAVLAACGPGRKLWTVCFMRLLSSHAQGRRLGQNTPN